MIIRVEKWYPIHQAFGPQNSICMFLILWKPLSPDECEKQFLSLQRNELTFVVSSLIVEVSAVLTTKYSEDICPGESPGTKLTWKMISGKYTPEDWNEYQSRHGSIIGMSLSYQIYKIVDDGIRF